ncbi:serine/threonine protein kinase [Paenibacillus turpanensis]|uniref:serine/threonine protein kinase n=1 Tax=Paenibacillus turpanensis TaxID=2689078 RepID=UPI0014093EF5|nr:serine/threonine-protein kinase [Paenibacillus turpanensis]
MPHEIDQALPKGTILKQRYVITRTVALSDVSIVYLGRDEVTRERIAVKEFYPGALVLRDLDSCTVAVRRPSDRIKYRDWLADFFREGRLLRLLRHPNIVPYRDHFSENGTGYLVTAYCRGRTLKKLMALAKWRESPEFMERLMPELLETIQFIHQKGYIHGDLKPGNVIIGRDGRPVLIDFGSAHFYRTAAEHRIMTTPGFSALELHSKTSVLGPWTDIYSLAAILYSYFAGEAPLDVSQRLIEDGLVPVRSRCPEMSRWLSAAVMRGLAVEPARRLRRLALLQAAVELERRHQKRKRSLAAASPKKE